MASTDLKLEEQGTLAKPGPIGRLVRLGFGVLSLYYVFGLWNIRYDLIDSSGAIRQLLWNGIIPGLFLISYVINIGFSRAWKKWPAIASIALLLVAAGIGYLLSGDFESNILARTLQTWLIYIFVHLGLAFILAAILATPGCEMRAFHHLFSVITGQPTSEHHCPVGPLNAIDKWERSHIR